MFTICRVEVVNIGPNFYCHSLEKTALSNVSTSDEGVVHQYLVDLGVVTNSLEAWMQMDEDDGAIVVEVILHWEDHPELGRWRECYSDSTGILRSNWNMAGIHGLYYQFRSA